MIAVELPTLGWAVFKAFILQTSHLVEQVCLNRSAMTSVLARRLYFQVLFFHQSSLYRPEISV